MTIFVFIKVSFEGQSWIVKPSSLPELVAKLKIDRLAMQ
jgi:hypothetical protein